MVQDAQLSRLPFDVNQSLSSIGNHVLLDDSCFDTHLFS